MPCIPLSEKRKDGKHKRVGFVCGFEPVYLFRGYLFEVHSYFGPIPVKKHTHDPRVTIPAGFWDAWEAFDKLDKKDQAAYCVDEDNHYRMDVRSKIRRQRHD